jgi:hypothetical protein
MLPVTTNPASQKECREREKVDVLARFRDFVGRSKWQKARSLRELGRFAFKGR